jgi:hypothetical protein
LKLLTACTHQINTAFPDTRFAQFEQRIDDDHVLIYVSSPPEADDHAEHMYEMDEPYTTAMHQDLKRGLNLEKRLARNTTDSDMQAGLPLFEVYQFLSPGMSK